MRCYYRNGISCCANRKEFEDQSVKKGKLDQIGIRPIRVSHFGGFFFRRAEKMEREGEEEEEKKESKERYGLLWMFGFVWILVCFISRV